MYKAVLVAVLICGVNCDLSLPPEYPLCKRSAPEKNNCLKNAIETSIKLLTKGIPKLNVDSIEPIKIPSLSIGAGKTTVNVDQHYTNVEIHNIHQGNITYTESVITDDNFKLVFEAFINTLLFKAEYSLHGNILVFPISGNGTCVFTLSGTNIKVVLSGKPFAKKGNLYLEIKQSELVLNPSKVAFEFNKLFSNEDPQMGVEINKLLNDNWYDVFHDVKEAYESAMALIIKNFANLIFKKVQYHKIFLL